MVVVFRPTNQSLRRLGINVLLEDGHPAVPFGTEDDGFAVFGPARGDVVPVVCRETVRSKSFVPICEIADVDPIFGVLPNCNQALPVGTCLRVPRFKVLPAHQSCRITAWLSVTWVYKTCPEIRIGGPGK